MSKALANLKKLAIAFVVLTLGGLVVDYIVDKTDFPGAFTLFPLCLLIITVLVMLVIWLFHTLIQTDR